MKHLFSTFTIAFVLLLIACEEIVKDEQLPVIDMSDESAFPQNCAVVYRGESFTFRARFADNVELGSYSIEMHHNFDHHTHSTSQTQCEMEPIKKEIMPFLLIAQFEIPEGQTSFDVSLPITIPDGVDTGDYHFMIRLTDKAGWQIFKGISMKIAAREL